MNMKKRVLTAVLTAALVTGTCVATVSAKEEKTYKVPSVSAFYNRLFNDNYDYQKDYNQKHPDKPLKMNMKEIKDNSFWLNLLPTLLLLGAMGVMVFLMMKTAGGGGKIGNFGKSNAKHHMVTGKKATFEDVAGADEEKEEIGRASCRERV